MRVERGRGVIRGWGGGGVELLFVDTDVRGMQREVPVTQGYRLNERFGP